MRVTMMHGFTLPGEDFRLSMTREDWLREFASCYELCLEGDTPDDYFALGAAEAAFFAARWTYLPGMPV